MSAYQLSDGGMVIRTADQSSIPNDPRNVDFREYQVWVTAGNTPDPAPVAPAFDPLSMVDIWLLKIAFNQENRIRVLEGKATITVAQFKTALRALT